MMLIRGFGSFGDFYRWVGYMHPGISNALAGVFIAAFVVIIVLAAKKKLHSASDSIMEALKLR